MPLNSSSGVFREHSQSRENINLPEDEVVGASEGGIEEIVGSASAGETNTQQTHSCKPKAGLYISGLPHICDM